MTDKVTANWYHAMAGEIVHWLGGVSAMTNESATFLRTCAINGSVIIRPPTVEGAYLDAYSCEAHYLRRVGQVMNEHVK